MFGTSAGSELGSSRRLCVDSASVSPAVAEAWVEKGGTIRLRVSSRKFRFFPPWVLSGLRYGLCDQMFVSFVRFKKIVPTGSRPRGPENATFGGLRPAGANCLWGDLSALSITRTSLAREHIQHH